MQRRTIFDAVRRMLGRGFRRAEVAALDRAIDAALGDAKGNALAQPSAIGPDGIALIKRFEGCARRRGDGMVEAYSDPGTGGDPWTIGWGATGAGIGPGTVWTQAQCDERLARDLERFAADVARAIGGAPTSQHAFDALASFHYNTGALARSTLLRCHLAGEFADAAKEFARWKHAGGRVMAGLVRRRAAEAKLYLAGR
ncbi:glycoside hydrolase [Erythrobacter sp. QSSC1-22B]|uniref:lysozyme n=1 Tax=Erythrobacter sp. QSSC1-22B TaxID=1860125 RepID=UPI0008055F5D|nr:lysozyme [Erythrobacter sp. QSSC1-22B]OBX19110.1 glycoside hydrolase [Erythrobacter sp. QSSC1-22B]